MAAITLLGSATWDTVSGTKTVTATPAVNDLIVIVTAHSTNTSAIAPTDDNSSGTYTLVETAVKSTSTDTMQVWVRNSLIASAASTVFTHAPGTSTGGGLAVLKVTGMNRVGAAAERQSSKQDNAAAVTPTVVLGVAALTANAVVGAVFNNSDPAGITPRASPAYSEIVDVGHAVPSRGLEVMTINSGETGTSIAWGAASPTVMCALVVELEASGLVSPTGIASAEAFGTPSVSATVSATGIASAEALGTPVVSATLSPTGIASAEAFGTPTISSSSVTLTCTGIASAEAFGTPVITTTISPVGIASAEAFGTPSAVAVISPAGIASVGAIGVPSVAAVVSPTGIGSAQVFGIPSVGTQIICTGILSAEALGTPSISVSLLPTGIPSAAAFGIPVIGDISELSMSFYHPSDSAGGLSGGSSIAEGICQTLSSGFPGTGNYPVVGQGILRTGGSPGTAQLQLRAEVAAIITAKAGLTLVVEKIA